MRCYCRVINYGCMARYQLRVGLGLSLTPFRRSENKKARFGGLCFHSLPGVPISVMRITR